MKVVEQFKRRILDLAIRGKLVPQDPSDEPASELLARIRAEKAKLVKAGTIKKSKSSSAGSDGAAYEKFKRGSPFELPKGWAWCRLESLGVFTGGHTPSTGNQSLWGEDVIWVTSKDMKTKYIDDSQIKISAKGATELTILKPNAILMCTRSGILRRTFPVAIAKCELTINQDQRALTLWKPEMAEYVYMVLRALEPIILAGYKKSGTTVESIIWNKFVSLPIPIPPLAEQKRIVARIEELFKAAGLLDAAADGLGNAAKHLDKKILDLAIRGKLVPQNSNDEPASELLKRIAATSHKSPFENPKTPIVPPFVIPKGWAWCKISDIFSVERGGSPRPIKDYLTDSTDGINWIKIADASASGKYITSVREKIKPQGLKKTRRVFTGDLLLTNSMSFGHPYILQVDGCIHDGWLVLHALDANLDKEFVYYLLSSQFVYASFSISASGGVVQNLNADKVSNTLIPLPPIAEQKRIVAKIEELRKVTHALTM